MKEEVSMWSLVVKRYLLPGRTKGLYKIRWHSKLQIIKEVYIYKVQIV